MFEAPGSDIKSVRITKSVVKGTKPAEYTRAPEKSGDEETNENTTETENDDVEMYAGDASSRMWKYCDRCLEMDEYYIHWLWILFERIVNTISVVCFGNLSLSIISS